jgi:hypothetical protein
LAALSRRTKITAIAFGVFVFLGVSALLAKALSGAGNERSAVLTVLEAQARGDAAEVLERLDACRAQPTCVRVTRARVAKLKRPGEVEIVRYDPSIQVALTRQAGTARVVWRTDRERFPVVQCVKVRREGPLTGGRSDLLALSDPIGLQGSC